MLVVDDKADDLVVVEGVLRPLDVDVVTVSSGEEALRRLSGNDFALVLLDVHMPDLDGFETARRIKSTVRGRTTPIIFVTSLDGDRALEGYGTGAVDYLVKPFDPIVLRSKVAAFVDLHRNARIIDDQRRQLAAHLEERNVAQASLRAQAAELVRSNAELERFAFVAGHDLQEPLDVVAGLVELVGDRIGDDVDPELATALEQAGTGLRAVRDHLDDLLAYAEAGTAELNVAPVPLDELVDEVLGDQAVTLEEIDALVTSDPLPTVDVDRWQLGLVMSNLISNAVRYRSERPLRIHVGLSRVEDDWVVSVADNGLGIGEAEMATVFSAFGPRDGASSGGIGLALCRRILERHGGSVGTSALPGHGTTVLVRLPRRSTGP